MNEKRVFSYHCARNHRRDSEFVQATKTTRPDQALFIFLPADSDTVFFVIIFEILSGLSDLKLFKF